MFLFIFFLALPLLLVGLCDFLHYMRLLLLNHKQEPEKVVIFRIIGEEDLNGVTSIYEKMRWHGKYFASKLICVHSEEIDEEYIKNFKEKGIVFLKEDGENSRIFELGENYGKNGAKGHSRENYISQP